ncbi:MAG: beta-glucosidase, partial [Patescibacteria group bacterium]|nr:beta-glucosidase [Patescibacteria group bacterium]
MISNFFWGASTASHQVEGGTHNQWSEWEKANANRLAESAQQRLGWLPNYNDIKPQAENPSNYISGNAVEHYSRYKEDFALAKQLNLNALRFGIEWSRIEPKQG